MINPHDLSRFKVAFFDLDGTLLNSQGKVSKRSIKAIYALREKGVAISIATGRALFGAKEAINALSIAAPSTFFSGSLVINPATKERVFEAFLDPKRLTELLAYSKRLEVYTELYTDSDYYIESTSEFTDIHTSLLGVSPKVVKFTESVDITKILKVVLIEKISGSSGKLSEVMKNFSDLNFGVAKGATHEDVLYANVTSPEASREKAFHATISALKAEGFDTLAFGDAVSDIPLLGLATVGVAMGNSSDAVKEKARFITKSSDDEGIAYALEALFPQLRTDA